MAGTRKFVPSQIVCHGNQLFEEQCSPLPEYDIILGLVFKGLISITQHKGFMKLLLTYMINKLSLSLIDVFTYYNLLERVSFSFKVHVH